MAVGLDIEAADWQATLARERVNQRLIGVILRKAGAEVTVVENGQLAVEAALAARDSSQPFDVALSPTFRADDLVAMLDVNAVNVKLDMLKRHRNRVGE